MRDGGGRVAPQCPSQRMSQDEGAAQKCGSVFVFGVAAVVVVFSKDEGGGGDGEEAGERRVRSAEEARWDCERRWMEKSTSSSMMRAVSRVVDRNLGLVS